LTSVTPSDRLAGLLPVIVTGGRPRLADRPTAQLLPDLTGVTAPPVWLVREDDAPGYELDGHELATYGRAAAEAWAAAHWTGVEPFAPGRFLGAFPGREQACRLAVERGCWGVLQLDDNITGLYLFRGNGACTHLVQKHGGLAFYADILAAVTLSTNAAMCGGKLDAVDPASEALLFARPGFPYSLFIERVDLPAREPWYGPYEDDVLHAYQYGASAAPVTAAIIPPLHYKKLPARHGGGMRAHYGGSRAAGLQRAAPEMARISVRATRVNGRGGPRVYHTMIPGAIRTPLAISDRQLYAAAAARLSGLADEFTQMFAAGLRAKVEAKARAARRG
jgi:hypothetical protein